MTLKQLKMILHFFKFFFQEVKVIEETSSLNIYVASENSNFELALIREFVVFNHSSYTITIEDLNDKGLKFLN